MTAAWEHVLGDLDDATRAVERACVEGHADLQLSLVVLPHDLGPLPASLAARATAVLDRMRHAEHTLEAACQRAQRALVIADSSSPINDPHFIDTHS